MKNRSLVWMFGYVVVLLGCEPPPRAAAVPPFDRAEMTMPVLLAGTAPHWSDAARRAGIAGRVVARCSLTEDGLLVDCEVVASPSPLLNASVLACLATRRYSAVTYRGKPIRVRYWFPFEFRLEHEAHVER
jgi:TonB family protein